ncbi:MAG: hypothetical protein IT428_02050 [Planctomycetaceae bacterium]|nr:hypothetical protein [Planctomycetaceae bacterium]
MDRFIITASPAVIRYLRSPLYWLVSVVAAPLIGFGPFFAYHLARQGAEMSDWRVIACLLGPVTLALARWKIADSIFSQMRNPSSLIDHQPAESVPG